MKKIFLSAAFSCFCLIAFCQSAKHVSSSDSLPFIKLKSEPKFSLSVYGGYALSLGSTFKFFPDNISSVTVQQRDAGPATESINYRDDSKGLGNGARFGAGISYVLNDFINIGLNVDYSKSTIDKTRDSSYSSNGASADQYSYAERSRVSYTTSLLTFSPNITFKAIARPKFFIYNKLGAIVIFRPSSIQTEDVNGTYKKNGTADSSFVSQKKYDWGIRNPALGFMGAIGAQTRVSEKIRIFAEIQFTHIIFKVKNRMLTDYTMDGKQKINTLSVSEKEIVFKKDFTSSNAATDPNQPTVAIYQKFPITFAGLQAGLVYRF